jgi:group I intron endonuclease
MTLQVNSIKLPQMPPKGGVYAIRCTANNSIYYGSTANLRDRGLNHRSRLNTGCHTNRKLRADFIRYGAERFDFFVVAVCDDVAERLRIEAKCIKKTAATLRYNFVRRSGIHNPGKSFKVKAAA